MNRKSTKRAAGNGATARRKSAPTTRPTSPKANSAAPKAKPGTPTAKSTAPKAKPATPKAKSTAPKTKPAAPKAKPTVPKGKAATAKRKRAVGAPPARRAGARPAAAPRTLAQFMTQALIMEMEAAQRYTDFADAMEMHNNLEVAALFRKMAGIEDKHAQQIMAEMGWTTTPAPLPGALRWSGFEAPETTPIDDVHYLMQPYHALELALANEQRAERFFAQLAKVATAPSVRKAARELQEEEREHVELVRAWMEKVPKPDDDWAIDPDPPRYTD